MDKESILFDQLGELDYDTLEDGMCHFFHHESNWVTDVLSDLLEQDSDLYVEYAHAMIYRLIKEVSEKDLVEYFEIDGTPEFQKEQQLLALENLLEEQGFNYSRYSEDGVCVGVEFWDWTDGGVQMFNLVDGRNKDMTEDKWWWPEIIDIYEGFDVDDEIDLHRQSEDYRKAFTISQSVHDFEGWEKRLEKLYYAA